MDDYLHVAALVKEAIKEARDIPEVNILIAGRTGVGKSTLINSVFHGDFAKAGQGKPVTKGTQKISKKDVPLVIWDTRGLELEDFSNTRNELMSFIKKQAASEDAKEHIHIAWVCIAEDGRRVEKAETHLSEELAEHMPVIGVITKARNDNGFLDTVQHELPKSSNVVRVRALAERFDDGHELPPMGLKDLVEATEKLLPEAFKRAFAAAQKVSKKNKKRQAKKVVKKAAAAAGLAGASPVPFSDAAMLVPIQIGMIAKISVLYGLKPSRENLTALVASAAGTGAATLAGRTIVTNLLKLVPGAGTVVAGAISATTASTLTAALGKTYTDVLSAACEKTADGAPLPDDVLQELKKQLNPKQ